ncbi:MAG: hypothetical protein QOH91_172 [Mycobacterium sp.]|nr:hypothetical protein [Mycobacterium sp.]
MFVDIAAQTPDSLLSRRNEGVSTVGALLAAATGAVAAYESVATGDLVRAVTAVRRLLDELDERDHVMLAARMWSAPPLSQRAVAQQLGVHPVWVQRNQGWAEARLAQLLVDPVHHVVAEYAADLGQRLGPYVPKETLATELRRLDVNPDSQTAQVLLHLAGPYVRRADWFENTTTSGQQQATATVDAVFDHSPAPSTASLIDALTAVGMAADVATTYLETHVPLRRFGDLWVRWGDSAANRTEAVLHVRGTPATAEDIFAAIGDESTSLRAVQAALSADDRFIRTSRQAWGLPTWGIDQYSGIFDEVAAGIDAAGGAVEVDQLVDLLLSRLPDVAESSIRAYVGTLAFIIEGGTVRRRTRTDEWPAVAPLNTARGAFRNGDNEIRLALPVTPHVLRGSGLAIHPAVATVLGVSPGQRRYFSTPQGKVSVVWRLSSTNGPSVGSLRSQAIAAAANLTDTLVLAFGLKDASPDATRIDAEAADVDRLRRLIGRTVRNPAAALAASLDCRRADVATVLRDRGDHDLAELIPN